MRASRFPLAAALLALAAACSPADRSPTAPEDAPGLDTKPPSWIANCKALVRFNPPPIGTVFGAPVGQPPGTLAFVENGVDVKTERFNHGGGIVYNRADIVNAPLGIAFGDGHVARMNNMNFRYIPPAAAGPYYEVMFEYTHQGGVDNLSVNGNPLYIGPMPGLPNPYPTWSTSVSASAIPGGVEGTVRIWGKTPIYEVLIGGQEFHVDNVCFR